MKFDLAVVLALAGLAAASPIPEAEAAPEAVPEPVLAAETSDLVARQFGSSTANELVNGACRRVTFIFARGSTEPGNIGSSVGPDTCDGLKRRFGSTNVACQGVGGPYTASLLDNTLPAGTTQAAIGEGARLVNLAATKCPDTAILLSGYSQGAAVIHGTARRLSTAVQNRVAGAATYGDTRNFEDGGRIPPFPASKTRIFCNIGDGVCGAGLVVTAAHLAYSGSVGTAVSFLAGRVGN